ncbi:Calreticulin [Trachymyrmex septentrionalis]|uniref:Calreticulin n=1 Tax=Trachymyrmex septentrionalis TaxID=34720 RepID=A0A195FAW4_9HYME|nr:Calreticulin [Trachymyrmex septentrionalis]
MSIVERNIFDCSLDQKDMHGKNLLINKDIRRKDDIYTHLFLLPKKIKDSSQTKPANWDDKSSIDDPNDKKPEDWDKTPDPELYKRDEICGFDLWQVKSDTIFDNVLITDDPKVVCKFGEDVWKSTLEGEKRMKEIQNEEEKKRRDLEAEENEDNKNDEDDEDADEEEHTHSDNNAHDEL